MPPDKGRGQRPPKSSGRVATPLPLPDYDKETPKFCLRHLQTGFDVTALDKEGQAAFAVSLQKRSTLTWAAIHKAPRKGLGSEWIPASKFNPSLPAASDDEDKLMVFRYHGQLPMAGVRINDVFHVLYLEPNFNDLYDHGSS